MNKNQVIGLVVVIIIIIGVYSFTRQDNVEPVVQEQQQQVEQKSETAFDGKNTSFAIDNKSVTLVNGVSETSIENSSTKVTTSYFGNEAKGDLNGDGLEDRAFLVTQSTGGSGTFYYVVVALKTNDGYKTTNAFLIGDRIAPQTTQIRSDVRELYVNYADRKKGEPLTATPREGKTLYLKVNSNGVLEGLMR